MSYLEKVGLAKYSRTEDWVNSISHMAGGAFGFVSLILCIYKGFVLKSWSIAILGTVYSLSMIAMYSCSATYHGLRPSNGKKVMRMVDHSMIFIMIAGSITPYSFLVIMPIKMWVGITVLSVAWGAVLIGIPLIFAFFEKTKGLQVALYLIVGWEVIAAIRMLYDNFNRVGFWLLVSGGIVYTIGAILYGIGSKRPYFHSVFHFFILIASVLHFLSIYFYVFI